MAYRLTIILQLRGKKAVVTRFTLILLPHLPTGFTLYAGSSYCLYVVSESGISHCR